jgi:hypothetical protein
MKLEREVMPVVIYSLLTESGTFRGIFPSRADAQKVKHPHEMFVQFVGEIRPSNRFQRVNVANLYRARTERKCEAGNFRDELKDLLNRHSKEGASNTPDFILADYLVACLQAYDDALANRDTWHSSAPPAVQGVGEVG